MCLWHLSEGSVGPHVLGPRQTSLEGLGPIEASPGVAGMGQVVTEDKKLLQHLAEGEGI